MQCGVLSLYGNLFLPRRYGFSFGQVFIFKLLVVLEYSNTKQTKKPSDGWNRGDGL